ncbi:class I SAM-dependent methyltransferase [Algicella marina]|uniref:Methyltransferase domain-containing protein n=1 Tax=Algicella marina TaxID=2683284 RepID=A0A6P1T2X0_9RHOB|nr:class I SAM-dependent methyltransferase [Algicella marina]QHQ37068.1 methyltransferase domain-containing protein [Algicella marina]
MSIDVDTRAFYEANAAAYADFAEPAEEHPRLTAFMRRLPEGARVLDFGCGSGWAGGQMLSQGINADGIDASPALADEARHRYGLAVRVADFRTLSARQRYDGIWCSFALQHAPREDRPQIFERMHTALRPGGHLYIGVQKGPMDWRDDHGRLYVPFMKDELEALLNGFEDVEFDTGTGKNYDGTSVLNIYVTAIRT